MSKLKSISGFLSSNVAILIILFSIIAFFKPNGFSWATNYTAIFLGVAMFGMGLTIKTQDFKVVFTRPKELALGFVLQYTIMPLSAYVLAKVFQLPTDLALGVILVGCCPGGTASNVITYIAKGDVALSVGMTIVSTILAPLCTPILVYVLAGSWVEVSIYAMMISAVKVVLIPVLAGILLYRLFPKQIDSIRDILPLVSIVSIVMIISGIVGANAEKIMTCGALTFVVVMIHNGIGLLAGTAVGKMAHLDKPKTTAVAIEVGMQNSGLAISMATANFATNPLATLPGAIFSVWHNISGTIYANLCNREVKKEEVETVAASEQASAEVKAACQEYLDTFACGITNGDATDKLVAALDGCDCDTCKDIVKNKDFLAKKSQWIFGGDGWAYDIGFGGVDHVLASGQDINIMVFDTEVYSNTGGQSSKATKTGATAQFAAGGKETKKKDLAGIAMSYGYVYVAQIAMGADFNQTVKAIAEAEAYPGPSLIIAYAPCINHGIKKGMSKAQTEEQLAVECGYWNNFRFNPEAEKKFTLDSKEPKGDYQEFLNGEVRYNALMRANPEKAQKLFAQNEAEAMERYEYLKGLVNLYDGTAKED